LNLRVLALALAAAVVLGLVLRTDVEIPSLVLAAVGGLGLVALAFWSLFRPETALYVLAAYLPFSKLLPGDFGGVMTALNLTNLLFLLVFATWLFSSLSRGHPLLEFHPLHIPVLLYATWGCFAYLWHALGPEGLPGFGLGRLELLKRWLDPFVVYFLLFHGVRRGDVWRNVVTVLMTVVAVVAALAVWEYMDVGEGASLEAARVDGVMGQPNFLGAFLVYYMFLFVSHWLDNLRRLRAWLLLIPFLLCVRGIMATFSRGAYLAVAQGLLGLTFFKKWILAVAAVAVLILAVLNPWLLPPGVRYRFDKTVESRSEPLGEYGGVSLEEDLDKSSSDRILIWKGGLLMVREHPVMGVGLGRFGALIRNYAPLDRARDAHNAYLITAAEMGIPALLLFLAILAYLFWVSNRVYRRHPEPFVKATALGFLGGLSGLLMANMFGSRANAIEVTGFAWILAALIARADLELKSQRRRSSRSPGCDRR
jgi:O-antigen ligase